ncbi:CPBP family intramembrane glutamic endopeptidase [Marinitoga aeolica]|uniref:CPBP family intramembrane metalloprotease n=1 Tax=Marinitoga aeolica TaxID=2809031 RepID=A0ABY8PPI1_9BACT|nr:CPBP family intramembrane glutamic endopeptidase [Marinitoga aeolica]WGS64531.1 CPBP family intramembrane metalloprotease [Marinitoga aeolica]
MIYLILFLLIALYFLMVFFIEKKIPFEKGLLTKIIIFSLFIPIFKLELYKNIPLQLYIIFIVYGIVIVLLPEKIVKLPSFGIYLNIKRLILIPLSAATSEEVFFRGILNKYLFQAVENIIIVAIISSTLFALMHIFNYFNGIESKRYFLLISPVRFAFGFFFSIVNYKYGLLSVIIIHFLIDFPVFYRIYKKYN